MSGERIERQADPAWFLVRVKRGPIDAEPLHPDFEQARKPAAREPGADGELESLVRGECCDAVVVAFHLAAVQAGGVLSEECGELLLQLVDRGYDQAESLIERLASDQQRIGQIAQVRLNGPQESEQHGRNHAQPLFGSRRQHHAGR